MKSELKWGRGTCDAKKTLMGFLEAEILISIIWLLHLCTNPTIHLGSNLPIGLPTGT